MNTEAPDDIIEVINDYIDIEIMAEKWEECMGDYPFSVPIFDKANSMVQSRIKRLEEKYNDRQKWLSWYILDCDCGDNPFILCDDSGEVLIDSPEKIWAIIQKWSAKDILNNENESPPVNCGYKVKHCSADLKISAEF